MMEDSGYESYQDPRLIPPDEHENPVAVFSACIHSGACMRLYREFVNDAEGAEWIDEMCRDMRCGENCLEFESVI